MKTLLLIPMALTACGACLPDKPISTVSGYTKDGMPLYIEAEPTLGKVCKAPVVYESDGDGHTYSPEPNDTHERSEDTPEPSRDEPTDTPNETPTDTSTDTPEDTPDDTPTDKPTDTSKGDKGNNGWGNGDQSAPGNSLNNNKAENGGGSQKNHGKGNKN